MKMDLSIKRSWWSNGRVDQTVLSIKRSCRSNGRVDKLGVDKPAVDKLGVDKLAVDKLSNSHNITQILDLPAIYDYQTPSPICSAYFKNKKIEI